MTDNVSPGTVTQTADPTADPSVDPAIRALVTIETVERLVAAALRRLRGAEDDSAANEPVPAALNAALDDVELILEAVTGLTTATTCTLVKDQALSDAISRQAWARMAAALPETSR